MHDQRSRTSGPLEYQAGFSLIEILVTTVIIVLLMAVVSQFFDATQRRYRGNQLLAEVYQGQRSVLDSMTQQIGQAGLNPDFSPPTTLSAGVTGSGTAQQVSVGSKKGMLQGNAVIVDTGAAQERVKMTAVSPSTQAFSGVFNLNHAVNAPVISDAQPFSTGILTTTNGILLRFYGDINADGTLKYVEYSCYPVGADRTTSCPTTGTTTVGGSAYNLYTLYRSTTDVAFASPATANAGTPMLDNVVATNAGIGPSGVPVFSFQTQTLGTDTVVTGVNITLTLQTLIRDPDSGQFRTVTLSSQIIPRNIVNAILVFNRSGKDPTILPSKPAVLPMTPQ